MQTKNICLKYQNYIFFTIKQDIKNLLNKFLSFSNISSMENKTVLEKCNVKIFTANRDIYLSKPHTK